MRSVTINSDKPDALAEVINKEPNQAGVATWFSVQSLLPGAYDVITLGEPIKNWRLVQRLAAPTATVILERPTLSIVSWLTIKKAIRNGALPSPAFEFNDTFGPMSRGVILDRDADKESEKLKGWMEGPAWDHQRLNISFLTRLATIHRVQEFNLQQAYATYYYHHAKSSNSTGWYGPPNYEYWMKMNVRSQVAAAATKGVLQRVAKGWYGFRLWVLESLENEVIDHAASQRGHHA